MTLGLTGAEFNLLELPPPDLVRVELVGQLLHRVAENDQGWTASLLRQEGLESLFRMVQGSGAECVGPDVLGPVGARAACSCNNWNRIIRCCAGCSLSLCR